MKALTNSEDCSKSFLSCRWSISPVFTLLDAGKIRENEHVIGGFQNNFSESQATFGTGVRVIGGYQKAGISSTKRVSVRKDFQY